MAKLVDFSCKEFYLGQGMDGKTSSRSIPEPAGECSLVGSYKINAIYDEIFRTAPFSGHPLAGTETCFQRYPTLEFPCTFETKPRTFCPEAEAHKIRFAF